MTAETIPKYFYAEKCFSADSPVCRAFFCSSEFISCSLFTRFARVRPLNVFAVSKNGKGAPLSIF